MINGHGNNIHQYNNAIEVDFSSNIAFNNHASKISSHLSSHLDCLLNYPDSQATRLREAIAQREGVTPNEILVTNGSAEAFYLVAHLLSKTFGGSCRTLITTPSFAEYEDSCRLFNHQLEFRPLNQITKQRTIDNDSLWLASPNNPDGFRVSIEQIEALAAANTHCTILVDRAYNTLSSESELCTHSLANIITIESFTKLYGIPGLRLGYIVASPNLIAQLEQMRPPWSVNALSIVAGEYIIENEAQLRPDIEGLIKESRDLQESIDQLEGFRVTRSNCNFFAVEIEGPATAKQLQEHLVKNHRILIRDASNFRGLSSQHFRVATQERHNNQKLINALRQWR